MSDLNWTTGPFRYPDLVALKTIADGSCFFHAILLAFYIPYQLEREGDVPVSRISLVRDLRYELSCKLGEHVDLSDPNSPIVYDTLSHGKLGDFGQTLREYSLAEMQKELRSNREVGYEYHEFISNELNKDIYILDSVTQDVYIITQELDLLYKNRNSIVLLYTPGHFDLVGVRNPDNRITTHFDTEHPLIRRIYQRMVEVLNNRLK